MSMSWAILMRTRSWWRRRRKEATRPPSISRVHRVSRLQISKPKKRNNWNSKTLRVLSVLIRIVQIETSSRSWIINNSSGLRRCSMFASLCTLSAKLWGSLKWYISIRHLPNWFKPTLNWGLSLNTLNRCMIVICWISTLQLTLEEQISHFQMQQHWARWYLTTTIRQLIDCRNSLFKSTTLGLSIFQVLSWLGFQLLTTYFYFQSLFGFKAGPKWQR